MNLPVVPSVTPLVPETEPTAPRLRSPPLADRVTVGPDTAPETVTPPPALTDRAPDPVLVTDESRETSPEAR